MELHIVIEGRKDLAGQLYRQLRGAIESGRLAAGIRLPPTRLLAEQLGLARKTVSDTYAQLTYEGLLVGKVGSGTFVNARAPRAETRPPAAHFVSQARLDFWNGLATRTIHPGPGATLRGDFVGGASSPSQFPHDDWRTCVQHALRRMAEQRGFYSQPEGLPVLREAIARYVAFARGVDCRDHDVLVCNGAQQALDLLGRVLIEPGCTVAMDDPGYTPVRQLFESLGARVVGVPVDEQGTVVEAIPADARLIYSTPAHQFPLGMPLSPARRLALLAKASAIGALVIEDDYDSEFRYGSRPIETLRSLDREGRVAYVGTFSKTLLPELRLGYLIPPPSLLGALGKARQLTDWHSSTLPQWALTRFLGEGYLQRHVRRCHAIYVGRRERILARLDGDLAPWLQAVPSEAGFHLAALFTVPVNLPLLVDLGRQLGVGLYPLDGFFHRQPVRNGLLFGFGAIDLLDIDPALDRLRDLLEQLAPLELD